MTNTRNRIALRAVMLASLAGSALLSGCGSQSSQGAPLSKNEEAALRAAPGQPMPPEARAAMAKLRQGPPPGATAKTAPK